MSEILLTEPAKHYLLSGDSSGETVTVTVSTNEVNVIVRYAGPNQPVESHIIAQATTVDKENYSILLKQVQSVTEVTGIKDEKELATLFLRKLDSYLSIVEARIQENNEQASQPLTHLRNGLRDLLTQLG